MIVDFHTHIFPPRVRERREEYIRRDAAFAAMYASPKAKLASAEDLLASMEAAGVDRSVVMSFAWAEHDLCLEGNDYLLESAAKSGGRLIPFCAVQPRAGEAALAEVERCLAGGARGLGELRPDDQGYGLNGEAGALLAEAVRRHNLPLLFHVSEPVGHPYPGKEGLALEAFYRFVAANPDITVVGAHWGGGLPFYGFMPEVAALTNVCFDTAATPYLYDGRVYRGAAGLVGAQRILFGSDFPLVGQTQQRRAIAEAGLDDEAAALILGGNAQWLLQL